MTLKKTPMDDTQTLLTKYGKHFGTIRDVAIFAAAVITLVFNYLASPVREDLRIAKRDIQAQSNAMSEHETASREMMDKVVTRFEKFQATLDGVSTQINAIDRRLSRIEGRLEK